MARSYDIADLMTSDGEYITDNVRRKINGNFKRVMQMMQSELPSQQQQSIVSSVTSIVDMVLERELPEIRSGLMDDLMPVGSVIVTHTSSDPRLSHGTWQQVGEGRYVRAAGAGVAVGEEGGSNSVTLLPENLPASSVQVQSGSGAEALSADSSGTQQPVRVEPEYVALLFYRRVS